MEENQPNKKINVNGFSPSYEISAAFEGDNFERIKLAEHLANYIEKIRNGAVIAIDAPWGEGKTWFGLHLEKYLKDSKNHKTIFVDAFKQDYIEDPFLLISAEINSRIEDKSQQAELQKEAAQIMKYLTPEGAKAAMPELARLLIEISGFSETAKRISEKFAEQVIGDAEKWIIKKFENYEEEKKSFTKFKEKLEEFCTSKNQPPVVIFIDELDRCKPTFAVQLIERIKHLFDVKNLIFILLINRKQLEKAIGGVYGLGTESTQYLGKFINLSFNLPTAVSYQDYSDSSKVYAFIKQKLSEYNFTDDYMASTVATFNKELTAWTNAQGMSLRDIEQACTLFALSNFKPSCKTGLLTYFIVMKIMNPDLFKSLRSDNYRKRAINVESEAKIFLSDVISKIDSHATNHSIKEATFYFRALQELHIAINRGFNAINRDNSILTTHGIEFFGFNPIQHGEHETRIYFNEVYNLIDFPVDLSIESK